MGEQKVQTKKAKSEDLNGFNCAILCEMASECKFPKKTSCVSGHSWKIIERFSEVIIYLLRLRKKSTNPKYREYVTF